jgi:alkyl hydroperoxide reductase subunit AhpC
MTGSVTTGLRSSLTLQVCRPPEYYFRKREETDIWMSDYTPVCTTELGAFARMQPEFRKRGVKIIGLSTDSVDGRAGWINDINELSQCDLTFPIIGDKERKIAYTYNMIDYQDTSNVDSGGFPFTVRSVFVIDPKKTIRFIATYPASTGRNVAEVLRIIDSLQTCDKFR